MCLTLLDLDAKEKVDAEEEGETVRRLHNNLQPVSKTTGETWEGMANPQPWTRFIGVNGDCDA